MASDVSIQRYPTKKPVFVIQCSIAQDMRLNLAERGFLIYMLSKPESWEYHISHMAQENSIDEKTAWKYMASIIEAGYILRKPQTRINGRWQRVEYFIFGDLQEAQSYKSYEQNSSQREVVSECFSTGHQKTERGSKHNRRAKTSKKPAHEPFSTALRFLERLEYKKENLPMEDKENPSGSHVHKPAACKHAKPGDTPFRKEKKKLIFPIPRSRSAQEYAQSEYLREEDAIQALYLKFPFDKVDAWIEKCDWRDIYFIATKALEKSERIGKLINYIEKSIQNRIDNYIKTMKKAGKGVRNLSCISPDSNEKEILS